MADRQMSDELDQAVRLLEAERLRPVPPAPSLRVRSAALQQLSAAVEDDISAAKEAARLRLAAITDDLENDPHDTTGEET